MATDIFNDVPTTTRPLDAQRLKFERHTWGELWTGTKAQLQELGIGVGVTFPEEAGFGAMVASLTGEAKPAGGLPEIPDVLAEEICRSARRCWELLGREETRALLNRRDLNFRRAARLALAQGGLDGVMDPAILRSGLPALTIEQLQALDAVGEAMRKLRAFDKPGGADRYVAASVAKAVRRIQQTAPGAKLSGRTKSAKRLKLESRALKQILKSGYRELPNKQKKEVRNDICAKCMISESEFYRVMERA